jgi:hypothetical protein
MPESGSGPEVTVGIKGKVPWATIAKAVGALIGVSAVGGGAGWISTPGDVRVLESRIEKAEVDAAECGVLRPQLERVAEQVDGLMTVDVGLADRIASVEKFQANREGALGLENERILFIIKLIESKHQ